MNQKEKKKKEITQPQEQFPLQIMAKINKDAVYDMQSFCMQYHWNYN